MFASNKRYFDRFYEGLKAYDEAWARIAKGDAKSRIRRAEECRLVAESIAPPATADIDADLAASVNAVRQAALEEVDHLLSPAPTKERAAALRAKLLAAVKAMNAASARFHASNGRVFKSDE